jgi:hypothetical protein
MSGVPEPKPLCSVKVIVGLWFEEFTRGLNTNANRQVENQSNMTRRER